MSVFSTRSLALKWSFLFSLSATVVFGEYSNLYLNQLGFSTYQIGIASLMGAHQLLLPLFGFIGDRFRARKLVLIVLIFILFLSIVAPLLPLAVSFPTCFVDRTSMNHTDVISYVKSIYKNAFAKTQVNHSVVQKFGADIRMDSPTKKQVKRKTSVPTLSVLFVYMVSVKATYSVMDRAVISLLNVATTTYLKGDRARYGSYLMWCHIGGSVSLFAVGVMASHWRIRICGIVGDGYYITFVWAGIMVMTTVLAIPWIRYEYFEHRVINWTEVKSTFWNPHYILMLLLGLFLGSCTAFQFYWEFWYIGELSGSPVIMGVSGLIRRPFLALSFYLSKFLIGKFGDLKTIALSLFLFAVSFFAISFIKIPWLVIIVGVLYAAAYGFSYSSLTVHFSKPGSKASKATILGISEMVYAIGVDAGSGSMGLLFHVFGPKATLFWYSITAAIILTGFLVYIYFANDLKDYEELPESDDENKK